MIAVTLTGLCGGWLAGVAMGRSFSVAVRDAGIWALALLAGAIVSIVAGYVFVGASADLFAPVSQRLGIAIGSVAAGATGGVLIGAIGRQTLQSSSPVVSLDDASAG